MLEHIQLETLDKFKKALLDALSGGQGFADAASECAGSFMRLFDEQCKGTAIHVISSNNVYVFFTYENYALLK